MIGALVALIHVLIAVIGAMSAAAFIISWRGSI